MASLVITFIKRTAFVFPLMNSDVTEVPPGSPGLSEGALWDVELANRLLQSTVFPSYSPSRFTSH